jgi:hypothetical protein
MPVAQLGPSLTKNYGAEDNPRRHVPLLTDDGERRNRSPSHCVRAEPT